MQGKRPSASILRKKEIEDRTRRGETAEQISEALQAQGVVIKKGATTIFRLQTFWRLIPPEPERPVERPARKKRKRPADGQNSEESAELEGNEASAEPGSILHYPSNCSFGPKKRMIGAVDDLTSMEVPVDSPLEDDAMSSVRGRPNTGTPAPTRERITDMEPLDATMDLMSAELLVDLSTSALSAAQRLKDLVLARQLHQPVADSATGLPPSTDEINAQRRKVREAAGVVLDLSADAADGNAPDER